jgi:hypothetical protein
MRQLECIRNASLPRLAWCAILAENDDRVVVHCGPWIEVGDSAFVEGAWSAPYSEMDFPHALTLTGSGAVLTTDGVLFATPTHGLEPLHVLRAGKRLHCSNSLRLVLASADDDIDPAFMFYDVDIMSLAFGTKRCSSRIPTRDRNWVTLHHYCNLLIGKNLALTVLPKRQRGAFHSYSDYRAFIDEQVLLTTENSADPRRSVRYTPLSTISTGYDSPGVSVIARGAGCRECVTFTTSSDESNDSGKQIGNILGLDVTEYDPNAYRSRDDLPEAEFAATGGGGGSVIMTAFENRLGGKLLLTGNYGGEAWERVNNHGGVDMVTWDSAGADMTYFRTRVGFLQLAVPAIGYSEFMSLQKITNSEEMRPWRLSRDSYDRPIPRRIAEEAGVPREMFGQTKKFAARSLRFCSPASIHEPDLQQAMALASYRHFSQWAAQIKLYSSEFDRWAFALMHKLYWLNDRLIRSRKIKAAAQRLGIVMPPAPWFPIRFRKQRLRHRLLFHWGMEQIKPRYAISLARDATRHSQELLME